MLDRDALDGVRPLRTLLDLTAEIVASHVGNNAISLKDVPSLISNVHKTLSLLKQGRPGTGSAKREPAVPIKRSVTADFLICLEDGRKFKMLKGHLRLLSLTPEQYREKWGLPEDYPMVAPNYAKRRSEIAKARGQRFYAELPEELAPVEPRSKAGWPGHASRRRRDVIP